MNDDVIMDFAQHHGIELTPEQVPEVQRSLSIAYLDDLTDRTGHIVSQEETHHVDGET